MGWLVRVKPLRGGTAGTARIVESHPHGEPGSRDSGEDSILLELNYFGTRAYDLTLDVQIPGEEPRRVSGRFKVPRRAENVGWLAPSVGVGLWPGLELPVRAGPDGVQIDWARFLDDPGRKKAQKDAAQVAYTERVAEHAAKHGGRQKGGR